MSTTGKSKWPLTLVAAAGLLAASTGRALAADEPAAPESGDKPPRAAEGAESAESAEGDELGEKGEAKEEKESEGAVVAGADLVLGWGNVPLAVLNPASAHVAQNPQTNTYGRSDATSSNVQSLVLGLGAQIAEHVGLGVRVPITFAGFSPNGSDSRSTAAAGNVEFEGEYGGRVARGLRLFGALGVALPTADGDEIPPDLNAPVGAVNQAAFDRYSLAKAAAYARGYEDNALFEPHRFGLIPKVGLQYRVAGFTLEPYVKVENLVATSSALASNYVGELVGALRVGYWVQKQFELSVKAWFNTGFAGTDEDKTTSASVEPQVVLRFGSVRPYAGFILPFAGPPQDASFRGVRVGVAAAF